MREMRKLLSVAGCFVIASAAALGQKAETLTFEVASVRPSRPPQPGERVFFGPPRGGPGTSDPGQITWERAALRDILMTAYSLQTFQISAPDWVSIERYDIAAKVPPGTTKEQVNRMWQSLLKERFGLVLHHDSKIFQVDELTVAKGGSKLKDTDLDPQAEPFTPVGGPPKSDHDGLPKMNGSGAIITIFPNGGAPRAQMVAKGLTLSDVAIRLGNMLRRPVLDKTGLTGRYDFVLEFTPDLSAVPLPSPPAGLGDNVSDPGSNLASAVEEQLGLKLTLGKSTLDVIVIDHAEKIPTEN